MSPRFRAGRTSLESWRRKRLTFEVRAHGGVDLIGEGKHERFVTNGRSP